MIELIIYAVCLLASVFAVSGIDFSKIIYKGAIWQTRILVLLVIFTLTVGSSNLFIFFINYVQRSI